jgi:probable rRNA maturation factor
VSHEVDVVVEDARWADLERVASVAVPAALTGLDGCEVVVLGCDDARIAELNATFRGMSTPTNVLAWPSEERVPGVAPRDRALGDIAIAFETCAREAAMQGKPFEAHVTHLLVHAVLHLLGHDHGEAAAARAMEEEEVRIVAGLGFPDPYGDDR